MFPSLSFLEWRFKKGHHRVACVTIGLLTKPSELILTIHRYCNLMVGVSPQKCKLQSEKVLWVKVNLQKSWSMVYRSGYISLVAWQQHPIRPQPRQACSAILSTVSKAGTTYPATESCPSSSPSTPEVGRQGGVPAEVVHPEGRLLQGVSSLRTGPLHQDYLASFNCHFDMDCKWC